MPAVRHSSRIDTFELKLQMEKKLGSQKAEKYFNLLTRFLSLKVGKLEFDKVCLSLIGRENVYHHNQLLKAILKNAVVSKTPPPKQVKRDGLLALKDSNGVDPRNGLQALCRDVFPQSPRKGRTPNLRERKFKDRHSSLGVNEKTHTGQDLGTKKVEHVEVGKEVEESALNTVTCRRIPVTAPFGVNIHLKEKRKFVHSGSGFTNYTNTCHYTGQVLPPSSLENRLKERLKTEGLDVSPDCVSILSDGLESYLKRVIKPSLELAGSRSLHSQGSRFTTSITDFWVAIETNPIILGEDWPTQLEKISLYALGQ
uniref:uncharacterized protein LOC122605412 n=1 Tax=Erigeron canadensis TaxID=72917 RepID=UPI001CB9A124|nr:uncharacterized protein LOC122605412 [Erigeron canadensis]